MPKAEIHRPVALGASSEQLLDAAPDGVLIIDDEGVIRLVNRQAEALFGYGRDELIGRPLDLLIPDSVKQVHHRHQAAYLADPISRPMGAGLDLAVRRKDGTELPVDISLSSLKTEDRLLVFAAVRDVTDRKRLDEDRRKLELERQQQLHDEERAVFEARLRQSERLESIGQLAGGVAHDFNNLLAGIMNYAALVADGLTEQAARLNLESDEAFATLAQDTAEITEVAGRAAALTRQLLIFSRREIVKPEVLDLNSIVADMEKLLRRTIGENVDLGTSLAPDLPSVKADRGQVEQLLMNLAINARDAMSGGGKLRIETAEFDADDGYARLHSVSSGRYVRLTVSDTGSGMSPEVASRAFEPFFTTKPKGEGTGLGLATVYGIAAQSGGEVLIYSEPGLGTTIRVHLPVTQDAALPSHRPSREGELSGRGETILLVEDEEMVREPARRMLGRYGYNVLVASDADDAVRAAREHSGELALLLTDVVMPGRSGKQLAEEISILRPETKVLFMSGYSHDVIVHQGALAEGLRLIEKPFSAESLLRRVRETIDST